MGADRLLIMLHRPWRQADISQRIGLIAPAPGLPVSR